MRLLALPVLFLAVGCGSDGTKKPQLLDAKVFLDAGVDAAPTCAVPNTFGALTLSNGGAPVESDWFFVPTMGADAGKTVLSIGAGLPGSTATVRDIIVVNYVKPLTGFALNTAVPFDPSPTSATSVAYAYILGDYDTGTKMEAMDYFGSTGSITLTAVGESDGSAITGSFAASTYREIDENGADVANGCTSSLGKLDFLLKQKAMAFTGNEIGISPNSKLSKADVRAIMDRVQHLENAREQNANQ